MEKIFCTIFTPTYNRVDTLKKLYESLKNQTFKDFEWVIVDDGSKDNTESYIKSIQKENKVNIIYEYQKNAGKHVAINRGLDLASGKVFAIVDSDDYLEADAILKINKWFKEIEKENKKFAGVAGQKGYSINESVGSSFSGNYIDAKSTDREKYNITGDKFEIFYTEILKKYKFPSYAGEKFMTEMVVWNRIARDNYLIRWYQDIIYICEYLEDGLTKTIVNQIANSPKGYALNIKEQVKYDKISLKKKLSYYSQYYKARKNSVSIKKIAKEIDTNILMIIISILIRKIYEVIK